MAEGTRQLTDWSISFLHSPGAGAIALLLRAHPPTTQHRHPSILSGAPWTLILSPSSICQAICISKSWQVPGVAGGTETLTNCTRAPVGGRVLPSWHRTLRRESRLFQITASTALPTVLFMWATSSYCSCRVPQLPECFPVSFLEAPFTLLCLQQPPTPHAHALFLLLK